VTYQFNIVDTTLFVVITNSCNRACQAFCPFSKMGSHTAAKIQKPGPT